MVQAISNRSHIIGKIASVESADTENFVKTMVQVEEVNDVPGFENMLRWAKGKEIAILMPRERVAELSLKPDEKVECEIHKSGKYLHYASSETISRS